MRLTDLLALSHVPRWSIVPLSRPQTVSDHTFRVQAILLDLLGRLSVNPQSYGKALRYALTHDAAESRSGDIPRPFKRAMEKVGNVFLPDAEDAVCPWVNLEPPIDLFIYDLVRVADMIECYTWIRLHMGHSCHAARKAEDIGAELARAVTAFISAHNTPALQEAVADICSSIIKEEER